MNRLNPLYIVLLFFTVLFLSFYLLSNKKDEYKNKIEQVSSLELKAKDYKNLTEFWKNEKYINKTLDEILKNSMFKNENITKTITKESIRLKIESSNPNILDNFLNRILNKQLIIKRLEIEKNSMSMDIGIK